MEKIWTKNSLRPSNQAGVFTLKKNRIQLVYYEKKQKDELFVSGGDDLMSCSRVMGGKVKVKVKKKKKKDQMLLNSKMAR